MNTPPLKLITIGILHLSALKETGFTNLGLKLGLVSHCKRSCVCRVRLLPLGTPKDGDIPFLLGFIIRGFIWDIPLLVFAYVLFWGPIPDFWGGGLLLPRRTSQLPVLELLWVSKLSGVCFFGSRGFGSFGFRGQG